MEEVKNTHGKLSLTALKVGQKATITKIKTDDIFKLRKLMAFGIVSGTEVEVVQKYPAVVVQVGFTQVALDNEIASEILISER